MTEKGKLLTEIQSQRFAMDDAALFLDTHPECPNALKYHEERRADFQKAVKNYQEKYGPLTAQNTDDTEYWSWVTGPWPWEV
ncbi:MAG: spore coat protein CotJB [Clostridiales bacterium]|nr:spore coat protein CotJB [Clostridiales bacterium]